MSEEELSKNNISKKGAGCACGIGKNTHRYTLPIKLEEGIISFLKPLGTPCFDFNKIGFLKIENPNFCISGLRNTVFVSFYQKKPCPDSLDTFEKILILYVSQK
jgi:hypothetical protein